MSDSLLMLCGCGSSSERDYFRHRASCEVRRQGIIGTRYAPWDPAAGFVSPYDLASHWVRRCSPAEQRRLRTELTI